VSTGGKKYHAVDTRHGGDAFLSCSAAAAAATWQLRRVTTITMTTTTGVCRYICIDVCIYVYMHLCLYVCVYIYICGCMYVPLLLSLLSVTAYTETHRRRVRVPQTDDIGCLMKTHRPLNRMGNNELSKTVSSYALFIHPINCHNADVSDDGERARSRPKHLTHHSRCSRASSHRTPGIRCV
jgi:hypothetical protein